MVGIQILPVIDCQENGHASTFTHGKRVSVSVVFFFWFVFESPMALASYGRRTATGSPSVIDMQLGFTVVL